MQRDFRLKAEARLFPLVCGVHYIWSDEWIITLLHMPDEKTCNRTAQVLRCLLAHPEYNGIDASLGSPRLIGGEYCQDIQVLWKPLS